MFTPRWHHVTQIHTDGSGWNDCGEASLSRAIMEYDPTTPARACAGEWELVRNIHDPANPATIWDLIDRCGLIARSEHDQPGQGFTSVAGIQAILGAFGLQIADNYVDGSDAAMQAIRDTPLVLCWVDGTVLAPPTFPASYFGGDWGFDHLILSLPAAGLYNDPLSIWPDTRTDAHYNDVSIQQALGGVWRLSNPEPVQAPIWAVIATAALKVQPNHVCKAVVELGAGTLVHKTGHQTPHWSEVHADAEGGHTGWVLIANLKQAG